MFIYQYVTVYIDGLRIINIVSNEWVVLLCFCYSFSDVLKVAESHRGKCFFTFFAIFFYPTTILLSSKWLNKSSLG